MAKIEKQKDMSLEESRAIRVAMAKKHADEMKKKPSEFEKRESFRLYWAKEKSKYGKAKDLEEILWLHLKAIKMDEPGKFKNGIKNFGLKKVE